MGGALLSQKAGLLNITVCAHHALGIGKASLKARKLLRLPEVEELSGSVRIAAGDSAAVSLVNY